ncbi:uncharacterized protein [Chironomus tepperi]|uniref:uncharacterized protein n=1 Tax=Chironomus tepperi TaxID=113505 RepID=UPI00391F6AD9
MNCLKVESCCCFSLETGGKIMGWIGVIIHGIAALIFSGLIYKISSLECKPDGKTEFLRSSECSDQIALFMGAAIFGLVFTLIFVVIYSNLIRGISLRQRGKILPALVMNAIGFVVYIAAAIILPSEGSIAATVITGAITLYFLIVLFALYAKIRNEKNGNHNV